MRGGAWSAVPVALVVSLVILAAACSTTSDDGPDPASASTTRPARALPTPSSHPQRSLTVSSGTAWSAALATLGWSGVQEPSVGRVSLLSSSKAPAGQTQVRVGSVARVELKGGDRTDTSGYLASRAELYGRDPNGSWSGTPPAHWPDPPESTRWYDFSVYVPKAFPLATDARWFLFTQWKGLRGGSPPVSLEIRDKRVYLQVTDDADDVGDVAVGSWNRFTVGIRFSTDADSGRVELYRDGRLVDQKTRATLDVVDGEPDPVYLKQGIYRSSAWTQTQVLYFAPMTVTTQRPTGLDDE